MNHLFGTNFREMDAFKGRSQTTKGIWIARGVGIEPCTIVLDLEGTDGRERGEVNIITPEYFFLLSLTIIYQVCRQLPGYQVAESSTRKKIIFFGGNFVTRLAAEHFL
ncbi:hypothetical protein GW17_00051612 [Ensete ventricosum]|nr:hypothetical protein GW17_00051612 [Ensete ventricosum]